MMGIFQKIKSGLQKTRQSIVGGVSQVFRSFQNIDEELYEELEETLIMADIGAVTSERIVEALRQKVKEEKCKDPSLLTGMLKEIIAGMLQGDSQLHLPQKPAMILVIGVNGVGKTTTAINLAANLAVMGKKVLLVDADPQANATSGLGFDINNRGIYECITGECGAADVIIGSPDVKHLSVLPSSIDLVGADAELPGLEDGHLRMKKSLDAVKAEYDFIFIDCSPSLGYTTVNALVAADSVLIPVQCEYFALEGLGKLLSTIKMTKSRLNPGLEIEGFVMTMYSRSRLANQVTLEVREHFKHLAYDTIIQRNIRLSEAPSHGKPVILHDAASTGSAAYMNLAKEFMQRNRKQ